MVFYTVTMRHTEKTLESLAHMQYDLFCKGNRISRSVLSFGLMVLGVINFSKWWGALAIVYASYLTSSTYASANHTARKLVKGIKAAGMDFPASRYEFQKNAMNVITLPEETTLGEPLSYSDIASLGEDGDYFYIFRDQYGGYMIPKKELKDKEEDFRYFLEGKTGKTFKSRSAPFVKLIRRLDKRKYEKAKHNKKPM